MLCACWLGCARVLWKAREGDEDHSWWISRCVLVCMTQRPPRVPPCSWLCLWGMPLHHRPPVLKHRLAPFIWYCIKTLSVMCSVLKAKPLSKVIVLTCTVHFTNAWVTPLLSGEFWFFSCNKSCMASATPKGLNDLTPGLTVWVSKQLMLIQPFPHPIGYQVGGVFTFSLMSPFNMWRGYMGTSWEEALLCRGAYQRGEIKEHLHENVFSVYFKRK